jgi:hypothetical protein
MTESCSGLSGDLQSVSWYRVPNELAFPRSGKWVSGYWSAGSNQIVLAGELTYDGPTVRHEMLHALARTHGHSRELFLRHCGGIVACGVDCVADAEPAAPDPGAVAVTPAALEVDVSVSRDDVPGAYGNGFVTVTVAVKNPAAHSVTVQLPTPYGFSAEVHGEHEDRVINLPAVDPELAWFGPGEVKRHLFEFRLISDGAEPGLWVGQYVLGAGYGRNFVSVPFVIE